MNAAAATMMAFTRRPLLRMQMLRDVTDDYVPVFAQWDSIRFSGMF